MADTIFIADMAAAELNSDRFSAPFTARKVIQ